MTNLDCQTCGLELARDGAYTKNVYRLTHEHDFSSYGRDYILVECVRCGAETDTRRARIEPSKRQDKPEIREKRLAGFRSWKVNTEGLLTGIHIPEPWKPKEEQVATCSTGHEAPHIGHRCGFNAFYRFSEWKAQEGRIRPRSLHARSYDFWSPSGLFDPTQTAVGVVSASGRTILCETGWQSEKAKIEALIAYETEFPALGGTVSVRPLLEKIAERYGVPVISPDEAEAFCAVEGLEVSESLTGQESQLSNYSPGVYTQRLTFDTGPMRASLDRMSNRMLDVAKRWDSFTASVPDKPNNFQEAIEAKKNKGKFYDGLDTKKGLDKPNR